VVCAYLPSLLRGVARRSDQAGWDYQLAIEILALLRRSQQSNGHTDAPSGLTAEGLADALRIDALSLEIPMQVLLALGWVGRLDNEDAPYVLIADLTRTPLAPLVDALLLPKTEDSLPMWRSSGWDARTVSEALPTGVALDVS